MKGKTEIHYHWRRIVFMAVVAAFFLLLLFGVLWYRRKQSRVTSADLSQYTISWQGESYTGRYEGSTSKGVPSGTGTFLAEDDSFRYEGKWKKGVFQGNGTIQYGDGSWEVGSYSNGKRHGICRLYTDDESYTEALYDKDHMFGYSCSRKNGRITDETITINGMDAEELKASSVILTNSLIEKKQYLNQVVCVQGTVAFSYEDGGNCYFRVESEDVGMVTGSFADTWLKGAAQAFLPRMDVGTEVILYGFYNGFFQNDFGHDYEYYGYSCVNIEPLYGELMNDETEPNSYEALCAQPYLQYGKVTEGEYIIERCVKDGKTNYLLSYLTGPDHEDECIVLNVTAGTDSLFLPGEVISVQGYLAGQYKDRRTVVSEKTQTSETVYTIYPQIRVLEYEKK